MAKKRKTLPKNIKELLDKANIEELKEILSKCELDAYGDYNKFTIIGFENCPDEITNWHIEQGGDINAIDRFKNTALHNRASSRVNNVNIKILIDLGADINHNLGLSGTPLHLACDRCCHNHIKTLLNAGADFTIKNNNNETALEFALSRCSNIDIKDMLEVSKIMLNAGVKITEEMKGSIKEIGENFEFFRPNFNDESVDEYSNALDNLYRLFDVEPVQKRKMHDGISKITINSERWQDQFEELWTYLIPGTGCAETIQGEVIRIAGRISRELEGNGGINWDADFCKMADTYLEFVKMGSSLDPKTIIKLSNLIENIKKKKGSTHYLGEMAVQWVLQNPLPIKLETKNYNR